MSSMFCKQDYRCKNKDWCARDFNPKSDMPECFEPMTNGDRIRAMTDAQLAEFLAQVMDKCWNLGRRVVCGAEFDGECEQDCPMYECCNDQQHDNIEEWLSQEVQE